VGSLIPFLARLFDIKMHNGTLSADCKRAVVLPIHKGGDRSLFTNYRPVSLTSMVCKEMEHVIASYLRHVWDKNDWLYEDQHGFSPGYSCEIQVITVCQNIVDSMDKSRQDRRYFNRFLEVFSFSSP